METMVFWRSSSEMSRPWRWLTRRILKRSVESWSGVASQGAGLHNAVRSEPSPQPTSSTWCEPYRVTELRIMIAIRNNQISLERRFLTALTFSLLKTSSTHICRCSNSGGKKVTDITVGGHRALRLKDG